MKASEYLLQEGVIQKITRGRRSQEQKDFLDAALAKGVVFSDYPKENREVTTDTGAAVQIKAAPSYQGEKRIPEIAPYIYNEETHTVKEMGTNTKRSLREACCNCQVSLVQCTCGSPTIVATNGRGLVRVSIERT